jgi:hypothetical protein
VQHGLSLGVNLFLVRQIDRFEHVSVIGKVAYLQVCHRLQCEEGSPTISDEPSAGQGCRYQWIVDRASQLLVECVHLPAYFASP